LLLRTRLTVASLTPASPATCDRVAMAECKHACRGLARSFRF
jgi:hypothetical protein